MDEKDYSMILTLIAFLSYLIAAVVQLVVFIRGNGNKWRQLSHLLTFFVCLFFAVIYSLVALGVLDSMAVGALYLRPGAIVMAGAVTNQTLCYFYLLRAVAHHGT